MQKEEGVGVPENKKIPQIGNTLCAQSEKFLLFIFLQSGTCEDAGA